MSHQRVLSSVHIALVHAFVLLAFLLATLPPPVAAAAATPADLEAWSDWVVRDIEDYGCPLLYNAASRRCAYPGRLDLALHGSGGSFSQTWNVYREGPVFLPGDREHWPLDVVVDDRPATVIDNKGRPALTLGSGAHSIRGVFRWQRLPAALTVPPESALITLQLAGTAMALVATTFLIATARADEAECIRFFGDEYQAYMKMTKRFIPFLF